LSHAIRKHFNRITSEREAKQEGIVLIDKPKLVVIMELVRTERLEKARRYFDQ
jgi:hypothetical protein